MMRLLLVAAALMSADGGVEQSRLDDARAKWADQSLEDYRYVVARGCFCPREFTRSYDAYVRNQKPYEPVKYVRDYASVPRLFAVIQTAIDEEYDGLDVEYGPTGMPTRIALDPSEQAIDEESFITATKLRKDTSIDIPDVTIRDGSARSDLREARLRFAERGPTDYRYTVRYSCFCANTDPFTVRVRNGKAVGEGPSVVDLFDDIDRAIRRDSVDLRVRYVQTGRPKSIYTNESFMIADEELGVKTGKLRSP